MKCSNIQNDVDGKRSAIYIRALEKYGPEKAEEIYLRHMANSVDFRFSKNLLEEQLDKRSDNIYVNEKFGEEDVNADNVYTELGTNKLYARVTSIIAQWSRLDLGLAEMLSNKGIDSFKLGLQNQAKIYLDSLIPTNIKANPDELRKYKEEQLKNDPAIQEHAEQDIKKYWEAKQEWGTKFHAIVAEVATQWEYAYQESLSKNKERLTPDVLFSVIETAKRVMGNNWPVEFTTGSVNKLLAPLFKTILEEEVKAEEHLILKPELKVYTDNLKLGGKPYAGIAGSIDLLLISQSGKYAATIDFKTKSTDKAINFDSFTGSYIEGPFGRIDNTAKNRALVQQWMYAAILKEQGIDVKKTMTVVVPLVFHRSGSKIGENQFSVASLGNELDFHLDKNQRLEFNDVDTKVELIQQYFRVGDMPTYYSEARKRGISGITENWSGLGKDDQPQATYQKNHKEPYINRKVHMKYVDRKSGKTVIDFFSKRLDVTGLTEAEIRTKLSEAYDKTKETQANIGADIISYFEHPDPDKLPKGITNSNIDAIRALLHGFSNKTHRIHLAQEFMPELHGVGPDVLVLENRLTGVISLLSAVTTHKSKVSFESDGSKISRTSMFGKYITDKDLQPKSLAEELLTEPNTHDFISMKLGLTALYLRKRSGNTLNIDRMRVGSIVPGRTFHVTQTCIETEIDKLKTFENVAGEDFPKEYSDLLKESDSKVNYITSIANHLESLMKQVADNTDPCGPVYGLDAKKNLLMYYRRYKAGEFVGSELSRALSKYLETVSNRLKPGLSDGQVLQDPRFIAVSRAIMEFLKFQTDLSSLAKDRLSIPGLSGAVTSGDPLQMRLHVLYNEASAKIRSEMDGYMKEHKVVLDALMKEKGVDIVNISGDPFKNLYKDQSNPENRMMLKEEGSAEFNALTKAEQDYIIFFNKNIRNALVRIASDKYKANIVGTKGENGELGISFWEEGTVPVINKMPSLLNKENFTSWKKLRKSVKDVYGTMTKKTLKGSKSKLDFSYATQFDGQATDDAIGNSELRRKKLGLIDMSAPGQMDEDIETNLALILNLATLEAAEKNNLANLVTTVAAVQSVLGYDTEDRGKLTSEMIEQWKNMVIFSRYEEDPNPKLQGVIDSVNKASSAMLFMFSIRQAMIEFSTGTLQNGASLMANTIQNGVASFLGKQGEGGRFTVKDWGWASQAILGYNHGIEQMVYDCGMVVYDPADLKTPEFKGANKVSSFASKSGYGLNRFFFSSSITHTFVAIAKKEGFVDAYVKQGDKWVYDETKDPRFFAYDPENNIGDKAPITDDEKQKFARWAAVRKTLDAEGMMDKNTKRIISPLTANERSEIKNYATRLYGSFGTDAMVHGEAYTLGRAMFRYKKWAAQRISNYWTPTIRNADMYGHWRTEQNEETGEYYSVWVGDDFQGIIQTLGHMATEFKRTKSIAFMKDLNKYQKENISKLLADLFIALVMLLMVLPFLSDTTEEYDPTTGKMKAVKGDFAKTTFGDSAYKAATNAAADVAFVFSLPSMLTSVFPGLSVAGKALTTAWSGIGVMVDPETPAEGRYAMQFARSTGPGRTGISIFETAQKFTE